MIVAMKSNTGLNPFFIALILLKTSDAVKFTSSPPAAVTVPEGGSVYLGWKYDLEGAELIIYECGFVNMTTKKFESQVEGKTIFSVTSAWTNKVISYSNKTFSLINLEKADSGHYNCEITFKHNSKILVEKSNVTVLTVYEPTVKPKGRQQDDLPPEHIAGIAVGVLAVLVIIIVLAGFAYKRKSRRRGMAVAPTENDQLPDKC